MGMTKKERLEKKMAHFQNMMAFDGERRASHRFIVGVDEVGRGPLAGPVVSAAVVLPEDFSAFEIDDSKRLSDRKRRELDVKIREEALAYGIGVRDNRRIDEVNILNATKEAMGDAIEHAAQMLREAGHIKPSDSDERRRFMPVDLVLLDAVHLQDLEEECVAQESLIKGDSTSASIAAASIIAKVYRDDLMIAYDTEYPGYAFEKNKGYGTKAHYDGLREVGPSPIHRMTFLHED